jgi:hypothetical protein
LDSWPLKMGSIDCTETSVRNYHYSLRSSPEEFISYLLRGRSLKSRKCSVVFLSLSWRLVSTSSGYDRFLPRPFWIIIGLSYNLMLCGVCALQILSWSKA